MLRGPFKSVCFYYTHALTLRNRGKKLVTLLYGSTTFLCFQLCQLCKYEYTYKITFFLLFASASLSTAVFFFFFNQTLFIQTFQLVFNEQKFSAFIWYYIPAQHGYRKLTFLILNLLKNVLLLS